MAVKLMQDIRERGRELHRPKEHYVTEKRLYYYDSEEERAEHRQSMIEKGWTADTIERYNLGTYLEPEYVWCGWYYKTEWKAGKIAIK